MPGEAEYEYPRLILFHPTLIHFSRKMSQKSQLLEFHPIRLTLKIPAGDFA
jgi:hypothetical protein